MNIFKRFIKRTGLAASDCKAAETGFCRPAPVAFQPTRVLSPSFSAAGYFLHTLVQISRASCRKEKKSRSIQYINEIIQTNLHGRRTASWQPGYFLPTSFVVIKILSLNISMLSLETKIRPSGDRRRPWLKTAKLTQANSLQLFRDNRMQTIRFAQSRKDFRPQQGNDDGPEAANHR